MSTQKDYMDERMLHAFLDGELDGAQEEVLFDRLSSDSGLRAEMQQHLAMRKAIQHDNEAFTPPAAATSAIFAALGFSLPPMHEAAAAGGASAAGGVSAGGSAAGAASGGWAFRRILLSAGSAVLAILAAVLLLMQFPDDLSKASGSAERVVSGPPASLQIEETPALGDIPLNTTTVPARQQAARQTVRQSVTAAAPQGAPAEDLRQAPVSRPSAFSASDIEARRMEAIAARGGGGIEPGRVRAGDVQFFDLVSMPDGVTLYARNVSLRSDPAPAVVSQSDPWFRNMNLGLLYALSDHHAIGIEGGQESFPQTFTGIEEGNDVRYEQNPLAYWATAVYQFNGDALLPHVHPFAQAQVGGAIGHSQSGGAYWLGPLARATLGIKFRPFERIAVVAGVEGTTLLYRFQNNWFSTNKIGLTYGVAYEF